MLSALQNVKWFTEMAMLLVGGDLIPSAVIQTDEAVCRT